MSKRKNKKEFTEPNVVLCEGADATYFIISYLEYLRGKEEGFKPFVAFDFGGIDELSNFLSEIKMYPNFDIVKSILILRDSELSFDSSVQSIKSALLNCGYPVPLNPNEIEKNENISVAFSLFPTLSKVKSNGTLEDLVISNLSEIDTESVLSDINGFITGLKEKDRPITCLHKSKLYTYFSVTDKYITLKLGEATEAGVFNFECDEMLSLKELLIAIRQ